MMARQNLPFPQLLGASVLFLAGCATRGTFAAADDQAAATVPFEYKMTETYPLPASGMMRATSEDATVTITGSDQWVEAHYLIAATRERLARFDYRVNVAEAGGQLMVAEEPAPFCCLRRPAFGAASARLRKDFQEQVIPPGELQPGSRC